MERYYRAALSMVQGLGPVRMKEVLKKYGNSKSAWEDHLQELSPKIREDLSRIKKKIDPEKLAETYTKQKIEIILMEDQEYPSLLKEIYDPPALLYMKGSLQNFSTGIAVVGARRCSSYGKNIAETFSRELAKAGITIISGGARGIDTCAHRGALETGSTIAVLGNGVDIVYPPENKPLFSQIIEKGALLSEYAPGTPPLAGNFPARNRLISGLSQGILVVEAAEKSGSLITANLALEQNREIFSVPGSIFSELSKGTHKLIQQGAKLASSSQDVLEELGVFIAEKEENEKKDFTDSEKLILSILKEDEIISLEKICKMSKLEWNVVNLILVEMEMKSWIKNEGLQGYTRKIMVAD